MIFWRSGSLGTLLSPVFVQFSRQSEFAATVLYAVTPTLIDDCDDFRGASPTGSTPVRVSQRLLSEPTGVGIEPVDQIGDFIKGACTVRA